LFNYTSQKHCFGISIEINRVNFQHQLAIIPPSDEPSVFAFFAGVSVARVSALRFCPGLLFSSSSEEEDEDSSFLALGAAFLAAAAADFFSSSSLLLSLLLSTSILAEAALAARATAFFTGAAAALGFLSSSGLNDMVLYLSHYFYSDILLII